MGVSRRQGISARAGAQIMLWRFYQARLSRAQFSAAVGRFVLRSLAFLCTVPDRATEGRSCPLDDAHRRVGFIGSAINP